MDGSVLPEAILLVGGDVGPCSVPPLAMLLFSLMVLWFAREGHALYVPAFRPWYRRRYVSPSPIC